MIIVPGINGLGLTKGAEESYLKILRGINFKKIKLTNGNIKKQLNEIESKTKDFFKERNSFLGGDHSISFPLVKNFFERFGKNSKLLILDAHLDLMIPLPEPTHEEWLRAIVEEGFNPENILIVGVRKESENIDKKEMEFVNQNRIKIIFSNEFEDRISEIQNFVSKGEIYLSIDIDVFDCSIISSTGYPEKNGLNTKQIFSLLSKIKDKVRFFDLVEINLEKGSEESKKRTIKISKKILKTLDFN